LVQCLAPANARTPAELAMSSGARRLAVHLSAVDGLAQSCFSAWHRASRPTPEPGLESAASALYSFPNLRETKELP